MWADYICKDCNTVFEFKKEHGQDFPKSLECNNCNSNNTERFHGSMDFWFPAGESGGNSKNGYSSVKNNIGRK